MAFIFYDTETTGTNKRFDQILQFAAILTDDNLNEIDRFEIRSRVLPQVIPSPNAMRITRVTAAQLDDPNLPSHYEMVCTIREKLKSWEPAYIIGYNSIKFDEELLRSAFFRCLLPCYLTNTNGNMRLDTLKITQSASIFESENIEFPIDDNGRTTLKLDLIAPANGFSHENAHEAMADVEATLFMYKLLRKNAPDTWSRFMRFSNKSSVLDFTEMEVVFGFSDLYFGQPYTFLLHRIGQNPSDNKELICFNLQTNPDELVGLNSDELQQRLTQRPKPIRSFRANSLPDLIEASDAHIISTAHNITMQEIEDRAHRIHNDSDLKQKLLTSYLATKPVYNFSPYVEENIYNDFPSDRDTEIMESFHAANWGDRIAILNQLNDERYRELGEQLVFIEAPNYLSEERQAYWRAKFANRILGKGEPSNALTLQTAIKEADNLIAKHTGASQELLINHRERLGRQFQEVQLVSV